jgi:hypothetical protein
MTLTGPNHPHEPPAGGLEKCHLLPPAGPIVTRDLHTLRANIRCGCACAILLTTLLDELLWERGQ